MSMIPLLAALLIQTASAPSPPVTVPPVADWPALPLYPLSRDASVEEGVGFIRDEVEAGRCRPLPPPPGPTRLQLPVAILIGPGGRVRQIVPQAIGCPSVEQYVVGYLLSLTRSDTVSAEVGNPGWYRLTVSYRW